MDAAEEQMTARDLLEWRHYLELRQEEAEEAREQWELQREADEMARRASMGAR